MKKIRLLLIYLSLLAKKRRRHLTLGAILIATLITIFLSFKETFTRPTLVEGVIGTYREEDLPEVVTNLLSQSLVKVDKSGLPKPNLASEWAVKEEGRVYVFKLKENLYWLNGDRIKASQINIPLPEVEVSYPDDQTVQLKIADSFSPFPTLLDKPIFKKGSRVGTGPFKITNIQKDQIFVKKLTLTPKDKTLPMVVVKFYPNERIAKSALALGEISVLLGVNEYEDLGSQKTLKIIRKTNYQQLVTIFYNSKDSALSDENLRLALSFAAPSIVQEEEAKTSLPPTSWAFSNEVKDYLDNPEQARSYLSKIEKKGSIVTLTATSFLKGVGEKVVESWNKNGIKAVLRVESGIPQNFQALLIAQNIPLDPDQYSLWHSTQKTNVSKYSSARIDKDLEDGRKSQDLEVRRERYKDFQKVLLDHAPATFLYFPKYNLIYREKVVKALMTVLLIQLPRLN